MLFRPEIDLFPNSRIERYLLEGAVDRGVDIARLNGEQADGAPRETMRIYLWMRHSKVLLLGYTESDEFLMVVECDKAEVPRPRLVAWLEYELWLCPHASNRPPSKQYIATSF
jgi:hypothetical protein